jgi:hypothetical protein
MHSSSDNAHVLQKWKAGSRNYYVFVYLRELMREKHCTSRRTIRAYQHNGQIPLMARLTDCASESRLAMALIVRMPYVTVPAAGYGFQYMYSPPAFSIFAAPSRPYMVARVFFDKHTGWLLAKLHDGWSGCFAG